MQAEQLPRRSPRMIITPRQIEDRSDEIHSLKSEVAGLRDEVCTALPACSAYLLALSYLDQGKKPCLVCARFVPLPTF